MYLPFASPSFCHTDSCLTHEGGREEQKEESSVGEFQNPKPAAAAGEQPERAVPTAYRGLRQEHISHFLQELTSKQKPKTQSLLLKAGPSLEQLDMKTSGPEQKGQGQVSPSADRRHPHDQDRLF